MITFVSLQSQFSLIRGTISLEWTLLESFSLFLKGIGSLLNLNNQSGDFVKQISTLDQITRMSSSWAEKKKEGNRSKIHPPLEEEKKNKRRWRGRPIYWISAVRSLGKRRPPDTYPLVHARKTLLSAADGNTWESRPGVSYFTVASQNSRLGSSEIMHVLRLFMRTPGKQWRCQCSRWIVEVPS